MLKNSIIILLTCYTFCYSTAQLNIDDSLTKQDPRKAILAWEDNYNSAETNKGRVLVLLHTAYALSILKDFPSSLKFLEKTEHKLKSVNDHYFKSMIYSRLAMLFSKEGHYFKAKQLIVESFTENNLIINQNDKNYAQAFAYYHLIMIEHFQGNYTMAADLIPNCYSSLLKMSAKPDLKHQRFLMYTFVNFGDTYMKVKDYDKAEKLLSIGELYGKKRYETPEIFTCLNLMELNLIKKDTNKAVQYGHKALISMKSSPHLPEKNTVYNVFIEYFKRKKDYANEKKYRKLQADNAKKILLFENLTIKENKSSEFLRKENGFYKYIAILLLFVVSISIYFKYWIKRNYSFIDKNEKALKETKSLAVPVNLEKEILKKLGEFEKTNDFLNPKMSVAILASSLETNIQYLSFVINKNKEKNFNSYINMLRIQYIVKELNANRSLRTYKISHLATMAGFVSHSTFSKVFKQETGELPSEFIKKMKL